MSKHTRKRRKAPRRYSWALAFPPGHPRERALSAYARRGLAYARHLAEDARERRLDALAGEQLEPRLTIRELAEREYESPFVIADQIKQARIELFGKDLSDSAIRYRLRRDRERGLPAERPCAEAGCPRPLPAKSTARRRYCEFHLASHARVRRHRERRAAG